jgi:hypothetical protein
MQTTRFLDNGYMLHASTYQEKGCRGTPFRRCIRDQRLSSCLCGRIWLLVGDLVLFLLDVMAQRRVQRMNLWCREFDQWV